MNDNTHTQAAVAIAMAYNEGWFGMADQVQRILATHTSGDEPTILALSDKIAGLAAGGGRASIQ